MMRMLAAPVLFFLATAVLAQDLPLLPAHDHATWQAVGRINAAGYRKREMCTGTLIAPDQVLTAAHCVAGTDGVAPPPEDFTFVAGWLRGVAEDSVTGTAIWVHPLAYASGDLDVRYDLAILTLDRAATVAPLPVAQAGTAAPYGIVAYSTRRPHMLSAAFDCTGQPAGFLLSLDCPVRPGNSGGPVLARQDDTWVIAGVISAMGQTGALAVPVSRLPQP